MITELHISTGGKGLHAFTPQVNRLVADSGLDEGLCTLFIRHTSASLLIQENYDSSAQVDLENWLDRLVPENDPLYTHTLEGPDDMPAHIKSALTATQLSIPFRQGTLHAHGQRRRLSQGMDRSGGVPRQDRRCRERRG